MTVTKYASCLVVCVLNCYYAISCEFTVFVVSSEFPCQGLSVINGLDYLILTMNTTIYKGYLNLCISSLYTHHGELSMQACALFPPLPFERLGMRLVHSLFYCSAVASHHVEHLPKCMGAK